jgi:hypothetical protein
MASILDPRIKIEPFDSLEAADLKDKLQHEFLCLKIEAQQTQVQEAEPVVQSVAPSFFTFGKSRRSRAKDEVEQYLAIDIIPLEDDPLQWWKQHEDSLTLLARLAKKYLAVSTSSVASERLFSDCGITMDKRRTCLSPNTFGRLVFLRRNRKLYGTLYPTNKGKACGMHPLTRDIC